MSSNRYNRPTTPPPADYRPRNEVKKEEVTLTFNPCVQCGKKITEGYWGRYGDDSGVCSKTCDIIYQHTRPSLIDYVIVKDGGN